MAKSPSPSTPKKPQPIPWTHEETVHLIQAYQDKWYSLKRGQLKASQWEEVAVTVAARCGYDYSEPSKSALQCRHKIEKLRQRYRSEKQRLSPSSWPYFVPMDSLDRGPLPISALPYGQHHDEDDDVDVEDDDDDENGYGRSRSINYILRRPTIVNRFAIGGDSKPIHSYIGSKRRREEVVLEQEEEEEEEVVEVEERGLVRGLAAEIRAFSERFIGMENMKMEMMKETERCRMEMENKRIELILEKEQRIVDSIHRAFGSP